MISSMAPNAARSCKAMLCMPAASACASPSPARPSRWKALCPSPWPPCCLLRRPAGLEGAPAAISLQDSQFAGPSALCPLFWPLPSCFGTSGGRAVSCLPFCPRKRFCRTRSHQQKVAPYPAGLPPIPQKGRSPRAPAFVGSPYFIARSLLLSADLWPLPSSLQKPAPQGLYSPCRFPRRSCFSTARPQRHPDP